MLRIVPVAVGIPVDTATGRKRVFMHVPAVTCDLPAKAMLRNSHGHTGTCGCSQCTIKGYAVPSGGGHCIAFIAQHGEVLTRRTHESVEESVALAIARGGHVYLNDF